MNLVDLFFTHPSFMQRYQAERVQTILLRASIVSIIICYVALHFDWFIFEFGGYYIHSQIIFVLIQCFALYSVWRSILITGRIALFQPDYVRTRTLQSIRKRNLFFNVVFGLFFMVLAVEFLTAHFTQVNNIAQAKPHLVKFVR